MKPGGLKAGVRERLIQQALQRRLARAGAASGETPETLAEGGFDRLPAYEELRIMREGARRLGVESPFFRVHEGRAGATTRIAGREYVNFASYDYLGLCGHPEVAAAAARAIARYGTTVSASRLVAGERPIHRELEGAIAAHYGSDDALVLVSGHATNVTVIGYLLGPRDLILHDELIHNSVLEGAKLSGAHRQSFPHGDWAALDALLGERRRRYERILIVVEGLYSMDGDIPDLPLLVEIKNRHRAWLMVDEAHSFGVLGARGWGIREHYGLPAEAVDIWMGTLSKALAGCGGYIAGNRVLIDILRHFAPGFLYSVGLAPPLAAASLTALEILDREPRRVTRLQAHGRLFSELARAAGIDLGASAGYAVIPVMTGGSLRATRLANRLFERGIHVQPILYPAVPEGSARLRFFLSSEHEEGQIRDTVAVLARTLQEV